MQSAVTRWVLEVRRLKNAPSGPESIVAEFVANRKNHIQPAPSRSDEPAFAPYHVGSTSDLSLSPLRVEMSNLKELRAGLSTAVLALFEEQLELDLVFNRTPAYAEMRNLWLELA